MISFNFGIDWPWPTSYVDGQTDYITIEKPMTKHKCFSMQLSKSCNFSTIFSVHFNTRWQGEDHGGIRFGLELWRYFFDIAFYDMRHWNWKKKRWYTDEELKADWGEED
jgi:hypothetical protein